MDAAEKRRMSCILRELGQPLAQSLFWLRFPGSVCSGHKWKCIEPVTPHHVFSLSPPHGLSSGCGGRIWRLYVERSFEFTEQESGS
jgi:hypothetical protein